jgi:hypothetical protein
VKRDSSISRVALLAVFSAVSAALIAQEAAPVSVAKPPAAPVPGDAPAAVAKAPSDLIPAAFGIWTDRAGSSWSVEAGGTIGRIGSSMVNSGLALLVNEEKFSPYQPMMTPDGKEMVIQGLPLESIPGLQMQRRVRLLGESGGLRYAELFHNGSADPMTLSIGLTTNFSGNFKTFLSDRGRSEPLLLTPAETGVVVLPGSSQSSRAFLFTLAGGAGGERPTISSQNRYGLTFRYRLDLAPGETAVILHHVAQVVIPQNFDRRTLADLSRPHQLEQVRGTLDPAWLDSLVNAPLASGLTAESAFSMGGLASLGIDAGAQDLLLIGDATRLPGTAQVESLRLVSSYGEAGFPLARIAAIQGGKARPDGSSRVFLRDGQVLSGTLSAPGLHFVPVNGSRIELAPETLDRLVFADASGKPTWPAETAALIETHDGDRIRALAGDSLPLTLATTWGPLEVKLGELLWLRSEPAGGPGWQVELKDGTRCAGLIAGETLAMSGTELGDLELPVARLRQILTEAGVERGEGELVPVSGSLVKLSGDQQIAGVVSHTTLPILTEGTALEVPVAEVRRLVRNEDGQRYRFERWDGGVVAGRLNLEFLSVQVAGRTWQIPLRDIVGIELSPPSLNPETLSRIEGLITRLGSPDWATRESATRELGAFGYLARPVLQRELAATDDPEVERRLERVLSGLN